VQVGVTKLVVYILDESSRDNAKYLLNPMTFSILKLSATLDHSDREIVNLSTRTQA